MQYMKTECGYVLRVMRGEEITGTITRFVNDVMGGKGASVSAVGSVEDPVLSYFYRDPKRYVEMPQTGVFELASFLGNISTAEGRLYAHLHAVIASPDGSVLGGHFVSGNCATTVEVVIQELGVEVKREQDPHSPLKLWSLPNT
jgi:predicted DNA-binding protein with PD1-like motif